MPACDPALPRYQAIAAAAWRLASGGSVPAGNIMGVFDHRAEIFWHHAKTGFLDVNQRAGDALLDALLAALLDELLSDCHDGGLAFGSALAFQGRLQRNVAELVISATSSASRACPVNRR